MAQFPFSVVAGLPQTVCVSGSSDRFEIKEVVGGDAVPFYVNGEPVFVGGVTASMDQGGECATISEPGNYVILYVASECGGADPVFTVMPAPLDPDAPVVAGDSAAYEMATVCDLTTQTLWSKWFKIENDVISVLQDWTDTGRACQTAVDPLCSPSVGELFGASADDADFAEVAFTSLDINNPTCCKVRVVTSVGSYTVTEQQSFGLAFDCDVTLVSVSAVDADCDISAVQTVFSKKG